MLNYAGVDYVDKAYTIGGPEWKAEKDGVMPFANLPYIIDGDHKLSESYAVAQYICGKYKPDLLGTTPQEKAKVYQLQCVLNDKMIAGVKQVFASDDKAAAAELWTKSMAPIVENLAAKPFLLGANVTMVDFIFFEMIEYAIKLTDNAVHTTYPTL